MVHGIEPLKKFKSKFLMKPLLSFKTKIPCKSYIKFNFSKFPIDSGMVPLSELIYKLLFECKQESENNNILSKFDQLLTKSSTSEDSRWIQE